MAAVLIAPSFLPSSSSSSPPEAFDESELLECIRRLVEVDKEWAFLSESSSHLYIRPTLISTEVELAPCCSWGFFLDVFIEVSRPLMPSVVSPPQATLGVKKPTRALLYVIICLVGSYFSSGSEGLSLWANPKYVRAAKGGNGDCKLGGWGYAWPHMDWFLAII